MSLRIIAGALKGKKLYSVEGTKTRPTSDRVREAIFNIISMRIGGAEVLDLFAGTGAYGLEALSRGAGRAVFADVDRDAILTLKRNIQACRLQAKTKIFQWDIKKSLNRLKTIAPAFNLVFMDPPYDQNLIRPGLENLLACECLAKGACIVIEHGSRESLPESQDLIQLTDQRRYGKTIVSFFAYML